MNLANAIPRSAVLLPAAFALLNAGSAAAQNCQADADCGPGYVCAVSTGGACRSGPCGADGACPPPVCETFEIRYCTTAPCATDNDCPDSMVCHADTWQECSEDAWPCKEGESCTPPEPPSCVEHTQRACAERYNLPCTGDADCGVGFECVESVGTSCSGGGAVRPDGDGGVIVEPFPTECTTEPTGYFYCKLLELPCATDAECPDGLTCQQDYATGACAGGGIGGGPDGSVVWVDCGVPPPPTFSCKPPNYGGGSVGSVGGGSAIGGGPGGSNGPADAGTEAPGSGNIGGVAGGVAGGGGSALGGAGSSDAGAPPDEGEEEGEHHGRGRFGRLLRYLLGSGGCSATGALPAGDLSWLAVAGLLFAVTRRRR